MIKGFFYIVTDLIEAGLKKIGLKIPLYLALPITVLLLPIILLLGLCIYLLIAIWNVLAMLVYVLTGTHAKIGTEGLTLSTKITRRKQVLLWREIREIRQIWKPPFRTLQAISQADDKMTIDFVDNENLETVLRQQNIPLVKVCNETGNISA